MAEHLSDDALATAVGVELLGPDVLTEDALALLRRHLEAARFSERASIVGWLRTRADLAALQQTNASAVQAMVLDTVAREIERGAASR